MRPSTSAIRSNRGLAAMGRANPLNVRDEIKPPKKIDVRVDCGNISCVHSRETDASDRWAAWMSDPKNLRLLNSAPKIMTRDDITAYIEKFDQISHLLIGIFERQTGLHFGFFRLDIDHRLNRGLMFFMIGEQKYRHWSVTMSCACHCRITFSMN